MQCDSDSRSRKGSGRKEDRRSHQDLRVPLDVHVVYKEQDVLYVGTENYHGAKDVYGNKAFGGWLVHGYLVYEKGRSDDSTEEALVAASRIQTCIPHSAALYTA